MLQLTPQSRILLALAPVDFRNGIDGLAAVCRRHFARNPLDGRSTCSATGRHHPQTAVLRRPGILALYQALSQGRLQWWPRAAGAAVPLVARELQVLLWNGCPTGPP